MLNPRHLLRAAQWVRNPPSEKRVLFGLAVIAVALLIAGVEHMGWWPDWAQAERMPRRP